jgi:hypothetical protein
MQQQRERQWHWKHNQPLIGLVVYGFSCLIIGLPLSLGIAGYNSGPSSSNTTSVTIGIQILFLLLFVIYSALTDRGGWSVARRILWVFACWLLHAISASLTGLIGGFALLLVIRPLPIDTQFIVSFDTVTSMLGALPIILWAMWRSSVFVGPIYKDMPLDNESVGVKPGSIPRGVQLRRAWLSLKGKLRIFPRHDPNDIPLFGASTDLFISDVGTISHEENFLVENEELAKGRSRIGETVTWSSLVLYILILIIWDKVALRGDIFGTSVAVDQWILLIKMAIIIIPPIFVWKYAVSAYENGWRDHERFVHVKDKLEELKKSGPSAKRIDAPVNQHHSFGEKTRLQNLPDDLKEHIEERLQKFGDI